MSNKIMRTCFISNNDGNVFIKEMNEAIVKMQENGWKVEIQYSPLWCESRSIIIPSVLIIGREE